MLRPSRPMIRPFISSPGRCRTLTTLSAVCSLATRWMASTTMCRARCSAVLRASPRCPGRASRPRAWPGSRSSRSARPGPRPRSARRPAPAPAGAAPRPRPCSASRAVSAASRSTRSASVAVSRRSRSASRSTSSACSRSRSSIRAGPPLRPRRPAPARRWPTGDLPLAAAAGGGPDLLGVGLGLPVRPLQHRVRLGPRRVEHPSRLRPGGTGLRLRRGRLGARSGRGGPRLVHGRRWRPRRRCAATRATAPAGPSRRGTPDLRRRHAGDQAEPAQRPGTENDGDQDQYGQRDDRTQQHPVDAGHDATPPCPAPPRSSPASRWASAPPPRTVSPGRRPAFPVPVARSVMAASPSRPAPQWHPWVRRPTAVTTPDRGGWPKVDHRAVRVAAPPAAEVVRPDRPAR